MGVSDAEEPESDEAEGGCGIANDMVELVDGTLLIVRGRELGIA